jgi:beta-N-acetylhexosaminidase
MAAPRAAILGCAGPTLDDDERRFLREADPWGFILFARNVESRAQTRALVNDLRDTVGRAAPVFIDEEGGRVSRLGALNVPRWPEPADAVAGLDDRTAADVLRLRYRLIAEALTDLGIDCDCAPVTDVAQPDTHVFLATRVYGDSAARVARLAQGARQGLREGGVRAVIKHLPGHGRGRVDSHFGLPVVDAPRPMLDAVDFAAVRALADTPMGMTAHVVFTAIDPDAPATFSKPVIDVLRHDIGFDGLLMTDDISMRALTAPMAERATRALAAGCDLVTHCNGLREEAEAVIGATPRLEGDALRRAERALADRPAAQPFDAAAALARLAELGREPAHA